MNDQDFLAELRGQLLDAASRRDQGHRPRHARPMVLVAAAVALLGLGFGLLTLHDDRQAAADIDVSIDGADFVVRLTTLEARPNGIVEEARDAGLNLRIREVPVGPSQVGKFVGTYAERPADFRPIDESNGSYTGFRISKDWPGALELLLGRAARGHESWYTASNALAPGEPLACEPLLGQTVGAASRAIDQDDFNVRWFMLPTPGEVGDPTDYSSWKVVNVEATSPQDIIISATVDGSWPLPSSPPVTPTGC